ncbi:hypothetical protein X975_00768, partial [Stegodyphus mimosarum]
MCCCLYCYNMKHVSRSHLSDMAAKKREKKMEDENRELTDMFVFIQNSNGILTCLICQEKLAHNKKSILERHFKHSHLAVNVPQVM